MMRLHQAMLVVIFCFLTVNVAALDGRAFAPPDPPSSIVFRKRQATSAVRPSRRRSVRSAPRRRPILEVGFVPTPPETVDEMLCLANIQPGDVLYDLGSGDGRIPITAAKRYGIRAVGLDLNPKLIARARRRARIEGVADRVRFVEADLFRADLRRASVVTLYLLPELNVRLRPKLLRELKPGARIVSHDFDMGDWEPDRKVRVNWKSLYRTVYLWTVPARNHRHKSRARN